MPTFNLESDFQLHQKWHHLSSNIVSQNVQNFTVIMWLCLMNGWTNPLCRSQHHSGPGDDFLSLIGLFYRASQRPWQLQRWLSLACFHYKPWHLISLREMASERWGTRVAKPFFSALDDTLCSSHWCEKCLCVSAPLPSCFCPFCHLLKTHRFECLEFLMHLQPPPPPSQGSLNLGNSNQVWKKPVNLLWMTTTQNTER